jgi:hypothetical protein
MHKREIVDPIRIWKVEELTYPKRIRNTTHHHASRIDSQADGQLQTRDQSFKGFFQCKDFRNRRSTEHFGHRQVILTELMHLLSSRSFSLRVLTVFVFTSFLSSDRGSNEGR